MSEESPTDGTPDAWEKMLRSMLGDEAAEQMISALRAQGIAPPTMAEGMGFPTDNVQMLAMFDQLRRMLSADSGPVNWKLASDLARQGAQRDSDPTLTGAQAAQATQALAVADLWLDTVTDLLPAGGSREAWTRSKWVDSTLPIWQRICEPVAANLARALTEALSTQLRDLDPSALPQLGGMMAGLDMNQMVQRLSAAVFGMQTGQAVGTLARESFGPTGTGLPLVTNSVTALVVSNIEAFGEDLGIPADEVMQFIAVREAAYARLYNAVPWLRPHVLDTVERYSREISIDADAIEEAARSVSPTDPAALQEAMSSQVFSPQRTPAQEVALERLETALASVEGWVAEVTLRACVAHLPNTVALTEMMRRHLASGSAAEQMFASLLGYQARPRRAREAAAAWTAIEAEVGVAGRDQLWSHPSLMFTSAELDSPHTVLASRAASAEADRQIDEALAQMLDGTLGWAQGMEPPSGEDPTAESPTAQDPKPPTS